MHRLASLLVDAARGRFPVPDGLVEVLDSPPGRSDAVVAFTAHSAVACALAADEVLEQLDPDDLGAAMSAPFLAWVGERLGSAPGALDAVLVAPPADGRVTVEPQPVEAQENVRVARAMRYRTDVRVYGVEGGVVVLGRGLAGRLEVAVEVEPSARNRGLGRDLARAAVALAPPGEPLFAQVSPGNVASLRAFLAAGYRPIGSEVLFLKEP